MDAMDICRFEQNLEYLNTHGKIVYQVPRSKMLDKELKKLDKANREYSKALHKYIQAKKKLKKEN